MTDELKDLKLGDMDQLDFPWHKKFLLKFFPRWFMKLTAKELKLDDSMIENAQKLFGGKKVYIQPLAGVGGRGFIIFVDSKMSFWFFQDGGHFKYDGFEMGEYDDGEVTIFDNLIKS